MQPLNFSFPICIYWCVCFLSGREIRRRKVGLSRSSERISNVFPTYFQRTFKALWTHLTPHLTNLSISSFLFRCSSSPSSLPSASSSSSSCFVRIRYQFSQSWTPIQCFITLCVCRVYVSILLSPSFFVFCFFLFVARRAELFHSWCGLFGIFA